ncbi:hypothetical protein Ate01nite_18790 [Actinoplanes teichomyceticus]|nr:hypothetical protein Ate01nite_18790 [Actinoplanes teichomyceticus]
MANPTRPSRGRPGARQCRARAGATPGQAPTPWQSRGRGGVDVTDLASDIDADIRSSTATTPPTPPTARPQPPGGRGGGNQLTRTTVNLTPQAVAALDRMIGDGQGPNKSELINRGIQVLEIIQHVLGPSNNRLTIKRDDGTEERIWIVRG